MPNRSTDICAARNHPGDLAAPTPVTTIATLNHRDFTVVRPRHTAAFELIP
jgi:hypothetical protein